MRTKRCNICKKQLPITDFYTSSSRGKPQFHSWCKICYKKERRKDYLKDPRKYIDRAKQTYWDNPKKRIEVVHKYKDKLRMDTLIAYGGKKPKCKCCGESTLVFLAIDHVNGDGNKERKVTNCKAGTTFYRMLKRQGFPKGRYQVLCYNCNWAKHRLGKCPHQK